MSRQLRDKLTLHEADALLRLAFSIDFQDLRGVRVEMRQGKPLTMHEVMSLAIEAKATKGANR